MTDRSTEGNQFVKGFGGIGGFLKYKIDTDLVLANSNPDEEDEEDEDYEEEKYMVWAEEETLYWFVWAL